MTLAPSELATVWPPTAAVAASAGHEQMSPLTAIRRKCLDCCVDQVSEIRRCEALKCPLWPFLAGRHPYHALAQKQAGNPAGFQESDGIEDGGDES